MIRDTLLFAAAMLAVCCLGLFVIVDYHRRMTSQETFSEFCRQLWSNHLNQPIFWIGVRASCGLVVGMVFGFVMGHLFWPQA
jgi:hypothetical protein